MIVCLDYDLCKDYGIAAALAVSALDVLGFEGEVAKRGGWVEDTAQVLHRMYSDIPAGVFSKALKTLAEDGFIDRGRHPKFVDGKPSCRLCYRGFEASEKFGKNTGGFEVLVETLCCSDRED